MKGRELYCPKCEDETIHTVKLVLGDKESYYVFTCKQCKYPSKEVLRANYERVRLP
jgi:ribosomal protein L44E